MAKRKTHYGKKKYRGRRSVLLSAFAVVLVLAGWKLLPVNNTGMRLLALFKSDTTQSESIQDQSQNETNSSNTMQASVTGPVTSSGSSSTANTKSEMVVDKPIPDKPEIVIELPDEKTKSTVSKTVKGNPVLAEKLFEQGQSAFTGKDYITARDLLSRAVKMQLTSEKDALARKMLNEAGDEWLLSKTIYSRDDICHRYTVVRGDILAKVGRKFNIPYQFLMRINKLKNPDSIWIGQSLKVVKGPFNAIVDKSAFTLTIMHGNIIVKTFDISTGRPGRETPTGLWQVTPGKKQKNPSWTDRETNVHYKPDDPKNPLGERWIGLTGIEGDAKHQPSYGIHGTIEPEKLGTAASRGCIRMRNKDVELVYDMLTEGKSHVLVIE